jgi:hypothetical protein
MAQKASKGQVLNDRIPTVRRSMFQGDIVSIYVAAKAEISTVRDYSVRSRGVTKILGPVS